MEFNWMVLLFWSLIIVGLLLLIYGLLAKSRMSLIISGVALILPMLYFLGANNWFRLLALVPLVPFTLAYYTRK